VSHLCEWANAGFKERFAATPHSPMYAPLDPSPKGLERGERLKVADCIRTLTAAASVRSGDVATLEAEQIARYIRSQVDSGQAKFGDFLILTRKKGDSERNRLRPYMEALEAWRIPVEVSGAGAFGASSQVHDLGLLLRALADPQDGVSLIGVLRGPLFGVSDPELFAWRQAGGWLSIFGVEVGKGDGEKPPSEPTRVAHALKCLSEMYRLTRTLPTGAALSRILDESGVLALAATSPEGVDAGDLLHAVDRVRQVVEKGGTLADAADALEDDAEESSEVESIPLEPGRSDVVRLMNLHKAKGLEARVVFLADPCGGVKPRASKRIVREGSKATGWFVIERDIGNHQSMTIAQPEGWEAHEQKEIEYQQAEETRLLYVAATRAQDMLVVGRYAKKGSSRPWDALSPFLTKAKELEVPKALALPKPAKVDLSDKARNKALAACAAAHRVAVEPSYSVTSVTAEAKQSVVTKIVRRAEGTAIDNAAAAVQDTPGHRVDAGMAWGTLIHGLLEHAMRHEEATESDLRRLGMWLTVEQPEMRSVLKQAVSLVRQVSQAEFWREAKGSPEHHVEVPFATTDGRAILMGAIDLVFRSQTAWEMVDYKTDRTSDPVVNEKYANQLQKYKDAWRAITGADARSSIRAVR
jgi:ATP-dependent helicase/nuclease subunit A